MHKTDASLKHQTTGTFPSFRSYRPCSVFNQHNIKTLSPSVQNRRKDTYILGKTSHPKARDKFFSKPHCQPCLIKDRVLVLVKPHSFCDFHDGFPKKKPRVKSSSRSILNTVYGP